MALGKGLGAKVSVVMARTVNVSGFVSHSLWHNYSVCYSTKSVTGNTQSTCLCPNKTLFTKADFGVPTPTLVGPCVPSHFSHVRLFATLWTAAWQAPLSIGFPRQEYWEDCQVLPPGDLPNSGKKTHISCLLRWQAGSLPRVPPGKPQLGPTTVKLMSLSVPFSS